MWWLPEEDGPDRSGHRRKKKLRDRAKGHIVPAGTVHLKKIKDQNFKLLLSYRIVYILNVLCV